MRILNWPMMMTRARLAPALVISRGCALVISRGCALVISRGCALVISRGCALIYVAVALASFLYLLFPAAGAARADGGAPNLAYISGTSKGISVVDITQKTVTNTFSLTGDPKTIYLSLDGRFLYVTQPSLDRITAVTARTGQSFCTVNVPGQPSLLAFDAGSNLLYTAGNAAASITGFDPSNCAIKKTIKTSGPVYGMAVANIGTGANGNQLWVSVPDGLQVFDNRGLIASIAIPGGAQYVSIPPGVMIYVTTKSGKLYPVSLSTRQVLPPILSGGQFGPMDYDALTDEIYVPDMLNKQVDVLNPIISTTPPLPTEPGHVIKLGVAPQSIAITSDGQFGFIALAGGNVAMLDVPGKTVFDTVFVGGNPHFIITGLYPPLLGSTPTDVSFWSTVVNIAAYALIFVLLIVPAIFFLRRARVKPAKK
jgi:DNA-binding beta-propeller fold protein YncE